MGSSDILGDADSAGEVAVNLGSCTVSQITPFVADLVLTWPPYHLAHVHAPTLFLLCRRFLDRSPI